MISYDKVTIIKTSLIMLLVFADVIALNGPVLSMSLVNYKVIFDKTDDSELDADLASSSNLLALENKGRLSPFALVGRIREDIKRLHVVLESYGFYAGTVKAEITIPGQPGVYDGLDTALLSLFDRIDSSKSIKISIRVKTGPLYKIANIDFVPLTSREPLFSSLCQPKFFPLKQGDPAQASALLSARDKLLTTIQAKGYPFAEVEDPVGYLRLQQQMDIKIACKIGSQTTIGSIIFTGLKTVHESYLRRRLTIKSGDLYDPAKIELARQDLMSFGLFSDVWIERGSQPLPDGSMPVYFRTIEAKHRRAVSINVSYSTDIGGNGGLRWTHYNLFGNAERLDLSAIGTGVGGATVQGIGYDIYADFRKPDLWKRKQDLTARLEVLNQNLLSYYLQAIIGKVGLSWKVLSNWGVTAQIAGQQQRVSQQGMTQYITMAYSPLSVNFDNTGLSSSLESPTQGMKLNFQITPAASFGNHNNYFSILQVAGSTYWDINRLGIGKRGSTIFAFRSIAGVVKGASALSLPPDQRLYAGGSGTVRGYKYQGLGPFFPGGSDVMGGTSLDAATIEIRQKFFDNFGAAIFTDAGQVGLRNRLFDGPIRVGVGGGIRYYTRIGPIRLDVAFPLHHFRKADKFELYVGLGESF